MGRPPGLLWEDGLILLGSYEKTLCAFYGKNCWSFKGLISETLLHNFITISYIIKWVVKAFSIGWLEIIPSNFFLYTVILSNWLVSDCLVYFYMNPVFSSLRRRSALWEHLELLSIKIFFSSVRIYPLLFCENNFWSSPRSSSALFRETFWFCNRNSWVFYEKTFERPLKHILKISFQKSSILESPRRSLILQFFPWQKNLHNQ